MIAVIRISGLVEMPPKAQEALYRMRLRRKYSSVLLKPTKENLSLLKEVRNFVAYGNIDDGTLKLLIEKRGFSLNKKKIDANSVIEQLDKKNLDSLGLKPFFRLHPPRGGIDSKIHFPKKKGVLGDNKEKINDLIRRIL